MAKKEIKKTSNKEKKEVTVEKKNNKFILIAIVAVVLVIVIVIAVIIALTNGEEKEEVEEEKIYATEETIEEEYGFSKDDAIDVVKEVFNSDNYEFSATIREDNKYIVIVTNTETGSTYTYIVDPNDGSFSMQLDDE